MFAGLGLAEGASGASALVLIVGVFVGSAAWWLALALGVGALRDRLDVRELRWVNRLAGVIIVAFGVAALVSLLA